MVVENVVDLEEEEGEEKDRLLKTQCGPVYEEDGVIMMLEVPRGSQGCQIYGWV